MKKLYKVIIRTVTGMKLEMTCSEYTLTNDIYYINGSSFPKEIVESIEEVK